MENSPWSSMKTLSSTSKVGTIGDIVEDPRECIEDWIDEADRALADGEPFLIDL
jgi:hypothetical protein